MKKSVITMSLILILCTVSLVFADDESYADLKHRADNYWKQIRQISAQEFGSLNLEVTIHTSYNFEESTNASKGVGMGFSMPIYSKKDKIANRLAAQGFSEHGSQLVMSFKESIAHGEIIGEECRYTKTIMSEYGVEAAKAYFDCKRRLASSLLTVEQKERDIKTLIDPYLKNNRDPEIIRTSGGQ